uniref:Replication association protein n=2 Tax=Betasatellite TaxID=190729 RepID=C5J4S0_9VIRU|nr:replication association protein [Ageratum yellow leaf curl betasatellite]CAX68215.1 putative C1 protein [Ageratum leaf curl Cameroon betasatellite]CAX68216.1 putative C1 protein [Ageratum leaf curl Cameroon betasatellite]CAX68217.1 putative C1 protein [Ageratum leaf curl Cameroon betasatellite]
MTIKYKNNKGVTFVVNVYLQEERINCKIRMTANKEAYVSSTTYDIPYSFEEVIIPFDFNGTEEQIANTIKIIFNELNYREMKHEDIVEAIDMIMAENENIFNMQIIEPHRVNTKTSV